MNEDIQDNGLKTIFSAIKEALDDPEIRLLVHKEYLDEQIPGILAGYLIYSGLLDDSVLARTIMEEILGRPLSPQAIALIPNPSST
tara:strand:- start:451 stop:708 length:258 start_codon:yes stop_codon:yes gene_type:complete